MFSFMSFAVWLFLTKLTKIYSRFYTVESICIVLLPYLREVLKGRKSGFEPQHALTNRGKKRQYQWQLVFVPVQIKQLALKIPHKCRSSFQKMCNSFEWGPHLHWQLKMKTWSFWFSCLAGTGAPFSCGLDVYDWNSGITFSARCFVKLCIGLSVWLCQGLMAFKTHWELMHSGASSGWKLYSLFQ